MLEDRANNLEQLKHLISATRVEGAHNYFQFNVDDMLFYRQVDLSAVIRQLHSKRDSVLCAHLKLSPGITYSHTNDKMISALPSFNWCGDNLLLFDRTESSLDWNYPFDFCGSIYPLETVVQITEAIADQQKIRRPNTYEYAGNLAIQKTGLVKQKLCFCVNLPVMTVVTVNKVQDIYATPVYEFTEEEGDVLEVMNQYMQEGKNLDVDGFYAR